TTPPRSKKKNTLMLSRPRTHLVGSHPPLPRIPLQSGRLRCRHPDPRPSHPTSPRQRPHCQGSQLLQPRRTDPACRHPASCLQHRRPPPRRPAATPRPLLSPPPHSPPPPTPTPPPSTPPPPPTPINPPPLPPPPFRLA